MIIDPVRLERARHLTVIKVGPRQYKVGPKQWVDLSEGDMCYCEDAMLKSPQPLCKHVIAAMLFEGTIT